MMIISYSVITLYSSYQQNPYNRNKVRRILVTRGGVME